MADVIMFDFDGVILDTLELFERAFRTAARRSGYPRLDDHEAFLRLFDLNLYDGLDAAGVAAADVQGLFAIMDEEVAHQHTRCRIFPGMGDVLRELAARHPLYVISSNLGHVVEELLDRHGLDCFRGVLGGESEPSKVRKIHTVMGDHPGNHGWYVGDTVGDIHEGRTAGARPIAVTWGWHSAQRLAAAPFDAMVNTPVELRGLFIHEP